MGVEAIVKDLQKKAGVDSVSIGTEFIDSDRTPSGVFQFDLASGGGWPQGKLSIIYGQESSGKTNLVLVSIALFQKLNPDSFAVFVDVEHSFDAKWAAMLGVDVDRLVLVKPGYGEQAVDMTLNFMAAEDCGFLAVDSLAALEPAKEVTSDAGTALVGGNSQLIGKLMRKGVFVLGQEVRNGHFPTVVYVNQIRHKIGQMHGNPEYMPGGNAMRHTSGLTVRIYGKGVVVKEVSGVMPAHKETSIIMKKWKVPIVSINAEYDMVMIPHNGRSPGYVKDWNTVSNYLKIMGLLEKAKGGWHMFDHHFKNLTECRHFIYKDKEIEQQVKSDIIQAAVNETNGVPEELQE